MIKLILIFISLTISTASMILSIRNMKRGKLIAQININNKGMIEKLKKEFNITDKPKKLKVKTIKEGQK